MRLKEFKILIVDEFIVHPVNQLPTSFDHLKLRTAFRKINGIQMSWYQYVLERTKNNLNKAESEMVQTKPHQKPHKNYNPIRKTLNFKRREKLGGLRM